MRKSKRAYYNKYFETKWNNIKMHGKESIPISLKTVASRAPTAPSHDNGNTITNPYDIANTVNNYYYQKQENKNNLKNECDISALVQHFCNQLVKEIANIISLVNSTKASGPNSIPLEYYFFLKMNF